MIATTRRYEKEAVVLNAKLVLLAAVVAFVTALAVAGAQSLIMGKTYVAVTAPIATIAAILVIVRARKPHTPQTPQTP